jgi:hypothetical protein
MVGTSRLKIEDLLPEQPLDENQVDEVVEDQEEVDDSEGSASDNTLRTSKRRKTNTRAQ